MFNHNLNCLWYYCKAKQPWNKRQVTEGALLKQTSNPDFIFSIRDSIFASWWVFLGGAVILTGTWSRPTDRTVEFRLLIMETWCRGDDGGLSSVSAGLLNSVISSSRAALFEAIKSPNLKPKGFAITNYLKAVFGSLWPDIQTFKGAFLWSDLVVDSDQDISGSRYIKGTDESMTRVHSSVPLMHYDLSDLGSLIHV